MQLKYISFLIIISWILILILLEKLFPYQPGYKIFRKGFWVDFFWYGLAQSYLLGLVIIWIINWANSYLFTFHIHFVSSWPVIIQVLFFLITHDLWQYWFHRLQHADKYFWRIHEAAHATPEVDWLAGTRSHAIEILIAQTFEYAPIILLGASPETAIIKVTLDSVWGMYNHSNIKVDHGFLIRFFNGPQLHRWHHHNAAGNRCNFSTKFSIWDHIWKTLYFPGHHVKPTYGFSGIDRYPLSNYFNQFFYAFRKFR